MKFLKGLLYFVLILIVIVLLANAFAPSEKIVERSITIDAPLDKVYSQVAHFDRWMYWDPWYSRDTTQVRELKGTPGEVGYGYSWTSDNKDVGTGSMTITEYTGKEKFVYLLNFEGMGESEGYFEFEEKDGSTKVNWAFVSQPGFLTRFFNYIIDGQLGPDLENGLTSLKEYVESSSDEELGLASPVVGPEVSITTAHGVNYATYREQIPISGDMMSWYTNAYDQIYTHCNTNGTEPKGPASSLIYVWDPANDNTDVAAAVPISEAVQEPGKEVTIDAGKAMLRPNSIQYTLMGPYTDEGFGTAHDALGKWLEDNGKVIVPPVVEVYVKGPGDQVDSTEYVTDIYYYFE